MTPMSLVDTEGGTGADADIGALGGAFPSEIATPPAPFPAVAADDDDDDDGDDDDDDDDGGDDDAFAGYPTS